MKIGILGCGLIGKKRGLQVHPHKILGVFDPDKARCEKLALELSTESFPSAEALLASDIDIVLIAVPNNLLAPLAKMAIQNGKHVLVEKPAGISVSEIESLMTLAKANGVSVKVGFNHRFHPALLKTKELIDSGALGELMFLRARYGHGARLGYEKEWRCHAPTSGGGELIDQGVHILDLIYWYFGPMEFESALVTTNFWNTAVDDNAVVTVKDAKSSRWATFHVSCTEWKNTFSLELYGKTGKVLIEGLGGSYGKEKLTFYKMQPEMGPPPFEVFEFDSTDLSWQRDLENLVNHIERGTPLLGDLASALYSLQIVKKSYQKNGYQQLPCSK